MHTFKSGQTSFTYNGDLSGDVIVRRGDAEVAVSGDDLLAFAASVVRARRIEQLERASDEEILGGEAR